MANLEYRDRIQKTDDIREIACDLDTDEGQVSRKIHNFRSQYSTERKKQSSATSGSEGGSLRGNEEHYDSLQFLNDSMEARKSTSNLPVS